MAVVRVDGLDRLQRTLRQAGVDMKQFTAANRAAASVVANAAHPPRRTGRLAASVRTGATQKAGVVRVGNNRSRSGVPYAGPIHWGWEARGIRAQPFLSDAARASESAWLAVYDAHIDRIIDNIRGV